MKKVLLIAAFLASSATAPAYGAKPSLAVIPCGVLGRDDVKQDVGGIAHKDLCEQTTRDLRSNLVAFHRLRLVEKDSIARNLSVIKASHSPDHNDASRLKIGRILSAQYLIISGLQPSFTESVNSGTRLDAEGKTVAFSDTTRRARIRLSVDLIHVESGEIQTRSFDKQKGGFTPGDMTLSDQFKSIVADATREAAAWIAHAFPIRATVVQVQGQPGKLEVVLNVGVGEGVQPKQRYRLERVSGQVVDPDTGKMLDLPPEDIGNIEIKTVGSQTSLAKVKKGTPKVQDVAVLEKD